ncbi:MAG: hypothetical protein HZA03_01300 [Nitrospinae bacterium]|nr:hypothetical protein [Nitrospinota bacterium]
MAAILYFVSGHGFGHAVRSSLVIRELSARGCHCTIVSSAPQWIFDANLAGCDYAYRAMTVDEGVFQIDSLHNDLARTHERWRAFVDGAEQWLEAGMALVRETGARGIVSDVAPLAFPLARRTGLPSVLTATFTWNWILDFYRDENPAFTSIAQRLREWYLMADAMIHTPFAYGLPPVTPSFHVPLIAKKAAAGKREIRKRLGWEDVPHFFVSFGGCGVNGLDALRLREMPGCRFVFLGEANAREGNIIHLANSDPALFIEKSGETVKLLKRRGGEVFFEGNIHDSMLTGKNASQRENFQKIGGFHVSHQELVAACDAVIGKPGYGTVAECVLNRTPFVYTSRGKFAEYEPMAAEMNEYIPTLHIPHEELFAGGLRNYLDRIPPFTASHKTDPGTGARDAAAIILRRFGI